MTRYFDTEIVDGVRYVTVPCVLCMAHVSVAEDALRFADRKTWPRCLSCSLASAIDKTNDDTAA